MTAIAVLAVPLATVPAAHAADGAVTGTVTASSVGGLPGIEVSIYRWDDPYDRWAVVASRVTDARGDYAFTLPTGDYRVGFRDRTGTFVDEFHEDAEVVDGADTVHLTTAGADIDAELAPAAHLAGRVTAPGGDSLAGVRVVAHLYSPANEVDLIDGYSRVGSGVTAEDGTYDIGGLRAGTYHVEFDDAGPGDGTSTFATEFWPGKPTIRTGTDVVLAAAQTRDGIDAGLVPDAQVSGEVTDASGDRIIASGVSAYLETDRGWDYVADADIGAGVAYTLDGLPAGTYRFFFGAPMRGQYVHEWWNDADRFEDADDVVLVAGGAVTGIGAQLVPDERDSDDPPIANTILPTVQGDPVVGSTVIATAGAWSPRPTVYSYEWFRDGQPIVGAWTSTYVPTTADIGHTLTVHVRAGGVTGWTWGHAQSAPTGPVAPASVPTPAPTPAPAPVVVPAEALTAILDGLHVTGAPKVGRTVRIRGLDASFRATSVSYRFRWYAGSAKITKATTSKLRITSAMKGRKISVKVTATASGAKVTKKLVLGRAC